MKRVAEITDEEYEIIQAGTNNPNLFLNYFFAPRQGGHGWQFDENFKEQGKWQEAVCLASQTDITIIGGFATGKTMGVGMAAAYWAAMVPDFAFLNAAQKIWQAKQMWDIIIRNARNTRFDDLIYENPRSPWYKIVIRYRYKNYEHESTLEFMSVDKNATGILSWEGDWLNIDEAGTLLNLEEVMINTGSRLRGSVKGRSRLGRFSMTSNSWDNFDLWYWFDQAVGDSENFLSLTLDSRDNLNITEKQLMKMSARIPPEERERFLSGTRPEGRGRFFSKQSVFACEDHETIPIIQEMIANGAVGYVVEKVHGAGVTRFEMAYRNDRFYMMLGDPGEGDLPRRNSPVIMVWDVTEIPVKPATLAGFWWGSGHGKISPFIDQLIYFSNKYTPIFIGIDTTGPQKHAAYLINEHVKLMAELLHTEVLSRTITGLNFSGGNKSHFLLAGRLFLESRMFSWPLQITGFRSQITNYEPENDKKIPQDIVATLVMSAYSIRTIFNVDLQTATRTDEAAERQTKKVRRLSNEARARRTPRVLPETSFRTGSL